MVGEPVGDTGSIGQRISTVHRGQQGNNWDKRGDARANYKIFVFLAILNMAPKRIAKQFREIQREIECFEK